MQTVLDHSMATASRIKTARKLVASRKAVKRGRVRASTHAGLACRPRNQLPSSSGLLDLEFSSA
jgi:hypothetical protein